MQMTNALAYINDDDIYINTLETSVRTGTTGFSAVGCQTDGARVRLFLHCEAVNQAILS